MALSTLEAIIATDRPVPTFDPMRATVIDEIIDLDGLHLPATVPLVDSHLKESVVHVLGSVSGFRRTRETFGNAVRGQLHFTEANFATHELYAGGHLSGISCGARRLEVERRDDGTRIVTRSELLEVSVVVQPADDRARVVGTMTRQLTGSALYDLHRLDVIEQIETCDETAQELLILKRCFPDADPASLMIRACDEINRRYSARRKT